MIAEILSLLSVAMSAIKGLVNSPIASDAAALVDAINQIYKAIDQVSAGQVTPATASAQIQAMLDGLAKNDAKADSDLSGKFNAGT